MDYKTKICVNEFCKFAISEEKGLLLREKMENAFNNGEKIEIDFSGISMFTTPFFNSSIGYFLLQMGPVQFDEKVILVGLEGMGLETYNHSRDNAIDFYNNKLDVSLVGKIVTENMERD